MTGFNTMKALILFSLFLSLSSYASNLSQVLPQKTGAQKEVAKLISQGQFSEGLMAWNSAFGKSSFSKTDTGIAVQGYLLSKSGLPVLGAHWIVSDTTPKRINKKIRKEIETLIGAQAYHLSSKTADKGWRKWIDDHSPLVIKNKKDLNWVKYLLKKTPSRSVNRKADLLWSLSVGAAKLNKPALAEKYIRDLRALEQTNISEDKIEVQLARILFQRGKLQDSIDSYSKIPKSSEFWLDAIEERAWAYLRMNNYDKARSDITTLLAPTFKDYASAEVYVLAAITNLKICDYPQILKDSKLFKDRHISRIQELESLAKNGSNTHIQQILEKMDQTGADLSAAAGKLASLPRMALRSVDFVQSTNTRSQLLRELNQAHALNNRLEVMGGFSSLKKLVSWAQRKSQTLRTSALREVKALAAQEVKEYRVMVNKLKLAEVEVIHRLNVDDSLKGKRSELGSVSHGRDVLVFPYEDEVWIDELDNYQARVKDCPTTKGASL